MENAAVAQACWALAMSAEDLEGVTRFLALELALGLERKAKPVASLADLLAGKPQTSP